MARACCPTAYPSKTFIACSDVVTGYHDTEDFGVRATGIDAVTVDAATVHDRVKRLALGAVR